MIINILFCKNILSIPISDFVTEHISNTYRYLKYTHNNYSISLQCDNYIIYNINIIYHNESGIFKRQDHPIQYDLYNFDLDTGRLCIQSKTVIKIPHLFTNEDMYNLSIEEFLENIKLHIIFS